MNNIIRFWNQNRRGIIFGVIALVLLIIVVHVLNDMAKNNKKEENIIVLTEEEKILPTKSIVGGEEVSIEKSKDNTSLINTFIEKCNNGETQSAYDMLSKDCKEEIYPTLESFEEGYRKVIFSKKRTSDISNFVVEKNRYTYLVKFYEDVLSTGKAQNAESYQDYITIDENLSDGKLNIKSFIYKKEINKESIKNDIKITALSQIIYKDYEEFEIKVENTSDKEISINTGKNVKSVYLIGANDVAYNSNIVELASSLYKIPAHMYRIYNLKFKKTYSSNVKTKGIIFSDIVEDYETYEKNSGENIEKQIMTISL